MHGPAQATKDKVGLGCRGRVGQKRLQDVEFLEKQRRIWLLILFEFEENDLKNSNQDLNLFKNRLQNLLQGLKIQTNSPKF
jgi:hypothetical protein